MKFNKWTTGLAALGVISLASAVKAEDAAPSTVLTALSSTTISGYVDTSAQWNFGTGNANNPPYAFGGASKADGFNLNVVQLSLDKPLDESQWAAGYHVDLWMGPDANALGTQSTGTAGDFAIRQAYVSLRMPVGNGIDWKIGVFDTIIGYESLASANNPNYTHSYGFTIEPTTHTGVLASYHINDLVSVTAGIANTFGAAINSKAQGPNLSGDSSTRAETYKTYMAAATFTAPQDWGWVGGSTFTAGFINGFNENNGEAAGVNQTSFYAGSTIATPLTALKLGASLDYSDHHNRVDDEGDGTAWAYALYASYQATEKLSLNLRGEYAILNGDQLEGGPVNDFEALDHNHVWAATATAQYDLWKNVISRVELRWDHAEHGSAFGGSTSGSPDRANAFLLAANVIYKF